MKTDSKPKLSQDEKTTNEKNTKEWLPSQSLTARPWKVTFPKGKDRLPTTIFQGQAVKLRRRNCCVKKVSKQQQKTSCLRLAARCLKYRHSEPSISPHIFLLFIKLPLAVCSSNSTFEGICFFSLNHDMGKHHGPKHSHTSSTITMEQNRVATNMLTALNSWPSQLPPFKTTPTRNQGLIRPYWGTMVAINNPLISPYFWWG